LAKTLKNLGDAAANNEIDNKEVGGEGKNGSNHHNGGRLYLLFVRPGDPAHLHLQLFKIVGDGGRPRGNATGFRLGLDCDALGLHGDSLNSRKSLRPAHLSYRSTPHPGCF